MTIRVYQVNDMELWAGDCTAEELLAAYMTETGVSHEDATGDTNVMPREVTDHEMDTRKFYFTVEDGEIRPPVTFREYLNELIAEGAEFPCLFGSVDW